MPKVLGRYHIISELGRGGMGVVYKAVDPKLERFIAIKCLSDELSSDELTVTRFLREARNVAALNHPHIAQIFLADEDEGRPYFVMEYIDGESLAERLAREKRLMPEPALRIVRECAEALKAAHEEHIIHRDIKPGNIMLDRRGRTVLTDFGIASIVHPDQESRADALVMGTPGYLPPEVIKGGKADHRGDIFALGAVLYEMLAGRRLVPGRALEDTARTLLSKDFPELGDLDEQIDEVTYGVLGRMIAPDPERRFQDYDDLLAGLRREQAAASTAAEAGPALDPTRRSASALSGEAETPTARNAGSATDGPPATVDIDAGAAEPPRTEVSPPPAGRHRVASLSTAAIVLLLLCGVAFGLFRLLPERVDQVIALFASPETDEPVAAARLGSQAADPDLSETDPLDNRAASTAVPLDQTGTVLQNKPDDGMLASAERLIDSAVTDADDAAAAGRAAVEEIDPVPARADDATFDSASTAVEKSAARVKPDTPRVAARSVPESASSSRPDVSSQPAPIRPEVRGALVIGQGDPVLVDPMVRAVEVALRNEGHEIVDRGFVSGLAALTAGEEIDLGRLAGVAASAGARYAVVLRAMPAGQRQLSYYGRSDTLFVVQMETITYDLVERRRLGATRLEQIDYTALNATEQARRAIAPRLALISEHLD